MELQRDIDKIHEWSKRWKLEFNAKKCHVMEMRKSKTRPTWEYKMGDEVIMKSREEKDLGVIVQDSLTTYKWDMWLDTQNVNEYQGGIPLYG